MYYDLNNLGIISKEIFLGEKKMIEEEAEKAGLLDDTKFIDHIITVVYNALSKKAVNDGYTFNMRRGFDEVISMTNRSLKSETISTKDFNKKINFATSIHRKLYLNYLSRNKKYERK